MTASREVVHHMNGDPTDNRPENLLIMSATKSFELRKNQQGARNKFLYRIYASRVESAWKTRPGGCCPSWLTRLVIQASDRLTLVKCYHCSRVLVRIEGKELDSLRSEMARWIQPRRTKLVERAAAAVEQVLTSPLWARAMTKSEILLSQCSREVQEFLFPRFLIARAASTGKEQILYQALRRRAGSVRCRCGSTNREGLVLDQGSTKGRDDCAILCLTCNQRLIQYSARELEGIRRELLKQIAAAVQAAPAGKAASLQPSLDIDEARFRNLELPPELKKPK